MPATVTVTRTVTSSSSSAVIINSGYGRSVTGLLKLFQIIIGAICLALIAFYSRYAPYAAGLPYGNAGFFGGREEALFFIVSFGFLMTTFLLFLSCLISLTSATILPKSTFESMYHFVAFIFYISASIALLVELNQRNDGRRYYREPHFEGKMAAAALGIVNSILYALSFFFSIRSFRVA